ncbi:hypothetical protein ILYODFUR_036088 [Ilyodon furcidens]|uniref:Uncharacterized protein n=1 Tax=Ilyodon furcidens TaxID=33524 RepID=A0ABV0UPZ1_9TELE
MIPEAYCWPLFCSNPETAGTPVVPSTGKPLLQKHGLMSKKSPCCKFTFKLNLNLRLLTWTSQMLPREKRFMVNETKISYLVTVIKGMFGDIKVKLWKLRTWDELLSMVVAA